MDTVDVFDELRLGCKGRLLAALREGMKQGQGSGDIDMAIANGHEGARYWLQAMEREVNAIRAKHGLPPVEQQTILWCMGMATEFADYGTRQWADSFAEHCSYWAMSNEAGSCVLHHGLPWAAAIL